MSIELLKLENAIEEFRKQQADGKYATDLQPQALLTFLMIARGHEQAEAAMDEHKKNECYVRVYQIKNQLQLSGASASRNVASLSDRGPRKNKVDPKTGDLVYGKGFNLVYTDPDPQNKTSNLLKLTDKGVALARRLSQIMKTNDPNLLEDRILVVSTVQDSRKGIDPKKCQNQNKYLDF